MAVLTPTPAPAGTWTWPADVLGFAAKKNVIHLLEPLRQAGLGLFPTGRLVVSLYTDHAQPDWQTIFFEMRVPAADLPNWESPYLKWNEELSRLDPVPRSNAVCLSVQRVR